MFTVVSLILVIVFVLIEAYLTHKQGKSYFSFEHSISSISTGILERALYLILAPILFNVFTYIYEHHALFHLPSNFLIGAALLLITDFVWYWYHRLGHRINIFWAAHSSDDFNLATATRITILQAIIRSGFWCALPYFGFNPTMITWLLIIHGAYSFFTHTQYVNKLGFLEHILITPSHHRVHHASNDKYLDKNFGDVFVFWDKLFNTFQKEEEKPTYGLTHPLRSHSFLWIHFHYYLELLALAKTKKRFIDKLAVIWSPPETMRPGIRRAIEKKWLHRKNFNLKNTPLKGYIYFQLLFAFCCLILLTLNFNSYDSFTNFIVIMTISTSLIIAGSIIEQRKWSFELEIVRLIFLFTLSIKFLDYRQLAVGLITLILLISFSRVDLKKLYEKHILRLNS